MKHTRCIVGVSRSVWQLDMTTVQWWSQLVVIETKFWASFSKLWAQNELQAALFEQTWRILGNTTMKNRIINVNPPFWSRACWSCVPQSLRQLYLLFLLLLLLHQQLHRVRSLFFLIWLALCWSCGSYLRLLLRLFCIRLGRKTPYAALTPILFLVWRVQVRRDALPLLRFLSILILPLSLFLLLLPLLLASRVHEVGLCRCSWGCDRLGVGLHLRMSPLLFLLLLLVDLVSWRAVEVWF